MAVPLSQSRCVAALVVALLHLALAVGLWQWQAKGEHADTVRSVLVAITRAPAPPPSPAPQRASTAPARAQAGRAPAVVSQPNARVAPAAADAPMAGATTASSGLPAAAPPAASGALNLALPKGSTAPPGLAGLAQQIRTDERANSPRPDVGERLFGGTGTTRVIQLAGGGQKIIGPQGGCTLITPNTWGSMNPMDPSARGGPSKVSDCSKIEPGARKHQRPP